MLGPWEWHVPGTPFHTGNIQIHCLFCTVLTHPDIPRHSVGAFVRHTQVEVRVKMVADEALCPMAD